jgi:hypothetical protein
VAFAGDNEHLRCLYWDDWLDLINLNSLTGRRVEPPFKAKRKQSFRRFVPRTHRLLFASPTGLEFYEPGPRGLEALPGQAIEITDPWLTSDVAWQRDDFS